MSLEPLLGPIEFSNASRRSNAVANLGRPALEGIHWVICGGESGPGARPMHPDWARSLRDQCLAAGVQFLFKQHGEWLPGPVTQDDDYVGGAYVQANGRTAISRAHNWGNGWASVRVGKKAAGRVLDGMTHDGFPVVR